VQRTGGELVLDSLKAAGVDTVFGIISVHNLPIFDAIAREGGVRVVPARTEHGAAAMADGFARATGRLAAALTSTGVGAANAAGSLTEAFVASSPVIHITGQVDSAYVDLERGFLHQPKDQLTLLDRVGKAAFRAESTEHIWPNQAGQARCRWKFQSTSSTGASMPPPSNRFAGRRA
jgi:acetolactate synthase I/II/III large subunit